MRSSVHALDGLSSLHLIGDAEGRRALWRSSLASLGSSLLDERRAAPLEGVAADQLLASVQVASADRLLDDVDFLSPEAAGAALYELAAALPPSDLKRELGRRILSRLRSGDTKTFVGLAAQLALSGSKNALSGPAIRARVALSLDLPLGIGTRADALALALISRRELSREWLTTPATGSLPSRRLAAHLLERAAREAARRAQRGDDSGLRIFQGRAVSTAMSTLLADRESLVWRHVASARGLLSAAIPSIWLEIVRDLQPGLGVTEWRRAAAALAASIAVRGELSLRVCQSLLANPIVARDRGLLAAIVLGLPRAMESDPALVEPMLEHLMRQGDLETIEAFVELRRERLGEGSADGAVTAARARLGQLRLQGGPEDEGRQALGDALLHELDRTGIVLRTPTPRELVLDALDAFATLGASSAHLLGRAALNAIVTRMGELEHCDLSERTGRAEAFRALRDLDLAALESDSLVNLLLLGPRAEEAETRPKPVSELFDRLVTWLEQHEGARAAGRPVPESEVFLRLRRVRTLLHLVDSDGPHLEESHERLFDRRLRIAGLLFHRVASDRATPLHRALCATAARVCDALVREESAEVSDVVLVAATHLPGAADFETLAEASMVPELKDALRALAKLDAAPAPDATPEHDVRKLRALAHALPVAASMRIEAMRGELLALADALEPASWVSSLAELAEHSADASSEALQVALQGLMRVLRGSKRRLQDSSELDTSALEALRLLDVASERRLRDQHVDLQAAVECACQAVRQLLPGPFARTIARCLKRIATLPADGPRSVRKSAENTPKEAPLPAWMPTSRTLGGFYVTRPLGIGAGGTVFVARRAEHRHDEHAEHFALKVPDYSGAAARTLSEAEFMQLFREEAGALLSLPNHTNIARFVTFDAGARPKSILVMELVEGPNLERLLEMRELDTASVFSLLDGIAAGLEAMHAVSIAHLDLKPANVIVRDGKDRKSSNAPVLVDFGLAGRRVRPGCGTLDYSAPEIWGFHGNGPHAGPPVDAYAFACMAFELLTGDTLFDAPNQMAMIARHGGHDGMPENLTALAGDGRLIRLAQVLSQGLRASPADRASIAQLRAELAPLRPSLAHLSWPLRFGRESIELLPTRASLGKVESG
jgi:hypothetical protein